MPRTSLRPLRSPIMMSKASSCAFVHIEPREGVGAEAEVLRRQRGGGPDFRRVTRLQTARDLLRRCCGLGTTPDAISRQLPDRFNWSIVDDTVLRPGEDAAVIQVHRLKSAPEIPDQLSASLLKLSFRACYCSVFDECWLGDLRSTRTRRVRQCPAPQHPFDAGGP